MLLTNSVNWRIYKVTFAKPIDHELVAETDFLKLNGKSNDDVDLLYLLTKEGWQKNVLSDFYEQKQALSRFFIGAMLLSDPVLDVIRRELKRVSPDVKIQNEQIQCVLLHEVLKREVVEGEKADDARKKIARAAGRLLRTKAKDTGEKAPATPVSAQCLPPLGGANVSSQGTTQT